MVLLHIGMRVRLTTQVLPPWAVQDATGTVMEIEASPLDKQRFARSDDSHFAAEMRFEELPLGVYVKLDDCKREFLPPTPCEQHRRSGFSIARAECAIATAMTMMLVMCVIMVAMLAMIDVHGSVDDGGVVESSRFEQ